MSQLIRMNCMGYRSVMAAAALLLAGCATRPPVDQIKYFSQAFSAVNAVGQPLLDDLALAERRQGQQVAVRRAKGDTKTGPEDCQQDKVPWALASDGKSGFISGFCILDAAYFADIGDPPATAALRGGLRVVEKYADVLSGLAEGRNADQAVGQISALAQEVDALSQMASTGAMAIAPPLIALKPLLASAARQANAAEARRLILEGAPSVTALIGAIRQATPALFNTLVEDSTLRIFRTGAATSLPADIARVDAYRVKVSQYVVLLDRLQVAWAGTVLAAQSPEAGADRLASLAAASAELRVDAEAVRRSLAAVRAGAEPRP